MAGDWWHYAEKTRIMAGDVDKSGVGQGSLRFLPQGRKESVSYWQGKGGTGEKRGAENAKKLLCEE